ncbi:MAG: hypothetical protein WBP41_10745 [Saprospiraceae bacterium]
MNTYMCISGGMRTNFRYFKILLWHARISTTSDLDIRYSLFFGPVSDGLLLNRVMVFLGLVFGFWGERVVRGLHTICKKNLFVSVSVHNIDLLPACTDRLPEQNVVAIWR